MKRDLPSLRLDQETQEACEAAAWREARRASVAVGAEKARRIERAWEVLADLAPILDAQSLREGEVRGSASSTPEKLARALEQLSGSPRPVFTPPSEERERAAIEAALSPPDPWPEMPAGPWQIELRGTVGKLTPDWAARVDVIGKGGAATVYVWRPRRLHGRTRLSNAVRTEGSGFCVAGEEGALAIEGPILIEPLGDPSLLEQEGSKAAAPKQEVSALRAWRHAAYAIAANAGIDLTKYLYPEAGVEVSRMVLAVELLIDPDAQSDERDGFLLKAYNDEEVELVKAIEAAPALWPQIARVAPQARKRIRLSAEEVARIARGEPVIEAPTPVFDPVATVDRINDAEQSCFMMGAGTIPENGCRLTFHGLAAIGYGNSILGFSGVIAMSLPYFFNYPVFRCVDPAALDDDLRSTDPAAIAIKIGAGGVVVATGVDFIDDRDPVDSMRVLDDDPGVGLDVPEVVLAAARRIGPLPAPMDEAPDPERAPAGAR